MLLCKRWECVWSSCCMNDKSVCVCVHDHTWPVNAGCVWERNGESELPVPVQPMKEGGCSAAGSIDWFHTACNMTSTADVCNTASDLHTSISTSNTHRTQVYPLHATLSPSFSLFYIAVTIGSDHSSFKVFFPFPEEVKWITAGGLGDRKGACRGFLSSSADFGSTGMQLRLCWGWWRTVCHLSLVFHIFQRARGEWREGRDARFITHLYIDPSLDTYSMVKKLKTSISCIKFSVLTPHMHSFF